MLKIHRFLRANSVDTGEVAHYEPPHLDLDCFCLSITHIMSCLDQPAHLRHALLCSELHQTIIWPYGFKRTKWHVLNEHLNTAACSFLVSMIQANCPFCQCLKIGYCLRRAPIAYDYNLVCKSHLSPMDVDICRLESLEQATWYPCFARNNYI